MSAPRELARVAFGFVRWGIAVNVEAWRRQRSPWRNRLRIWWGG